VPYPAFIICRLLQFTDIVLGPTQFLRNVLPAVIHTLHEPFQPAIDVNESLVWIHNRSVRIFRGPTEDRVITESKNPSVKNVDVWCRHGADSGVRMVDMGGPLDLLPPDILEHYTACGFRLKQPEAAHEKGRGYPPHHEMAVRRLLIHIAVERRRVPHHVGARPATRETPFGSRVDFLVREIEKGQGISTSVYEFEDAESEVHEVYYRPAKTLGWATPDGSQRAPSDYSMSSKSAIAPITEDEYWRMFHLIRGDVEGAIKTNSAYLRVNSLAVADPNIYAKLNHFADFWRLHDFALQTTFFIIFGRLFDMRTDSHSIPKLVDATIANPAFFTKASLRNRKREASRITGADPQWLIDYVKAAWEPNSADLELFRTALAPHYDKFRTIYKPIRHKFFAHKSKESEAAIQGLFDKTNSADVNEILRFLYTLIWAINEIAWNATRPDLTDFSRYEGYVNELNTNTERFVRQLP
jgi:AbiU2